MKVIGTGPGNPKLLTMSALEEIKKAKKVYAFKRLKEDLTDIREDIIVINTVDEMVNLSEDSVILATGDPLFFGIANTLNKKGVKTEVIPGISSCQYLLSKLNLDTVNYKAISFHGREVDLSLVTDKVTVFFTDKKNSPSVINQKLKEEGFSGEFIGAYNLSYDDEKIVRVRLGEELNDESNLSLGVFINEVD